AAAAFGDVEDDRDAGAIELIAQLGEPALRDERASNGLELEGDAVHVQPFGVQKGSAGKERRGGRLRGAGGEGVSHRNLLWRGREGRPSRLMGRPSRPPKDADAAGAPGAL